MDEQTENQEKVKDKLEAVETLLTQYEKNIHLDKINIIQPNMNVTAELMMSMSYEDVMGLAWSYGQYALALQKEINRQQRRFNWAETNLKRYLERESTTFPGFKWEERMANVLACDIYAQRLDKLKTQTKLAIDTLSFLPSKVQFLSEIARDIMKTKRYKYVEQN